ncbi:hypothetical protein HJG60_010999 [Phyllostomus discolor]|uniref:Uncharacterized protein n=1 Tax=Phyllostomus discolor TaxID=89673 RepID=A0A834EAE3_9CHIR|nr:hypothetical protein HJG60_010999 [Phyllostomus discolor]
MFEQTRGLHRPAPPPPLTSSEAAALALPLPLPRAPPPPVSGDPDARETRHLWPRALEAHFPWRLGQRERMRLLKGFLALGLRTPHRDGGLSLGRSLLSSMSRCLPGASSLILGDQECDAGRRLASLTCLLTTSTCL